ncbi:hypothetical protein quinque_015984 [Culex quinquefasciatus]
MKQVAVQDMKEFLTGWGAAMFPQTQNKMPDAHAPLHDNNTTCHQLSPKIRGVRTAPRNFDSQEKEKKEKLGNIGRESHVETTAELIGTASEINLRPTQTAHLRC